MDYIQIKNLDKFQPHYRDERKAIWIRWDIAAIGDYKISKLSPAQRWLFIGLIGLASKHKNQIPYDLKWIAEEVKYPEKHILNDLKMLQTLELLVTNCNELQQNSTYRQTDRQTDNIEIAEFFNYFLLKTKRKFILTPTNRTLIKKRLADSFTFEQMKQAVDNFSQDDWADRKKYGDLLYCIGIRDGIDNLQKWMNYTPKPKAIKPY